jgi:hypothetical protein
VTSPVLISGRASVFEAHVSITIFDGSGKAIANTFTLAQGVAEAPTPFSTQVPFAVTLPCNAPQYSCRDQVPRNRS